MQTIYSIGYGHRKIEDFIRLLKEYKIEYLVDVRSQPYSKYNPPFTQNQLQATLKDYRIGYLFLGEQLGGRPDNPNCYLDDGRVNYEEYEKESSYKEGIERLKDASSKGYRIAMMCSESKPHECHRSKLIGRTLQELAIPIEHIDENGYLTSQKQVIDNYLRSIGATKPVQTSFWDKPVKTMDEPLFTSRKGYQPKKMVKDID